MAGDAGHGRRLAGALCSVAALGAAAAAQAQLGSGPNVEQRSAEAHATHAAVTARAAGLVHDTLRERWALGFGGVAQAQEPGTLIGYAAGGQMDANLPRSSALRHEYEQRIAGAGLERLTAGGWWLGGLVVSGRGESAYRDGSVPVDEDALIGALYVRDAGDHRPYGWIAYAVAGNHEVDGLVHLTTGAEGSLSYERRAYAAGLEVDVEAFRVEQALTPGVVGETALHPSVALLYEQVDSTSVEAYNGGTFDDPLRLDRYSRLQGRASVMLEHGVPVGGWRLRGMAVGGVKAALDRAGSTDPDPVIRSGGDEIEGEAPELDDYFYRLGLSARARADDQPARGAADLQLQYLGGDETGWQASLGVWF